MQGGDKVRLKSDPTRIGTLTGEEQVRGGKRKLEVRFSDNEQFYLEGALELVPKEANVYSLFKENRFGRLKDLRGAVTYSRLSGKLANLIYSMDTTNTEFYAYQFKPVLAFVESPNHGILIADEVGLGKTIEAGLIWTEWRSRNDARRLLVICPAILREKWQDELLERFGVKADICSARDILSTLRRHQNGDIHEFALITSLQGIRPPRHWDDEENSTGASAELARFLNELEGEDPVFDLAIIDEAHYLRNPESQTSKLGGLIRAVSDGLVLLSATPIQLKSEDLYHQIKHLDEITFNHEFSFQAILESSRPLVELRDRVLQGQANPELLKKHLKDAQKFPGLCESKQIHYLLENVPDEAVFSDHGRCSELADIIDKINPISHVLSRTRKRDVQERRVVREALSIRVPMEAVEEEFYRRITERIRYFCQRSNLPTGFIVTIPQRQMTSSMAAACRAWLKKAGLNEEDVQLQFEALSVDEETPVKLSNVGVLTEELIRIASEIDGDYHTLRQIDSKYHFLLVNIRKYWSNYPNKKIIVFSFYRETLAYLHERLTEDGISSLVLQGGMDKQQAFQRFRDPHGPRLLLASEVASEGVDLQFCSLLINYDLPWNPQRIEQRIGRIDRIGQKEQLIHIWNIFHENTLDDRVHKRLFQRLNIFQAALGSIESVLGEDIREMTQKLFSHNLTPGQEEDVIEQTAQAIANRRLQEERLEEQASYLVAHGDYIQNKVNAARELKRYVTGEDLYHFVRDFLDDEYPDCRFVRVSTDELVYTIDLSGDAKAAFADYLRRSRLRGKTRLITATTKMRFRFENRVVLEQSVDEIISQFHPIIRFVSDCYQQKGKRYYFPVVGVEVAAMDIPNLSPGVYIFAVQRWSMRVAMRDIERLSYLATEVTKGDKLREDDAERLVNTVINKGRDWLAANNYFSSNIAEERFGECEDALDDKYHGFVESLKRENEDRIAFQLSNLTEHYEKKKREWSVKIKEMKGQGKAKGVRLWTAKLEKLRQRTDEKKSVIAKSFNPVHNQELVSSGVIRVY